MKPTDHLTHRIDRAPRGRRVAAFFDFDRTLIAGFSAGAFVREWVGSGRASAADVAQAAAAAAQFQMGGIGFSDFVTRSMVMLRGLDLPTCEQISESIYRDALATAVYPEARALVESHREHGHTVAIVSSATRFQIEPVARDLGIDHVLCTEVVVEDGRLTGDVVHPTCYGEGKATAGRQFAEERGIDLVESYFYTDSDEDLPLLEIVGRPRPVNANRRLSAIAARRGWPQENFGSRGTPGAVDLLRTSLAVGSMVPSFLLGAPAALLDADLREGMNLAASTWGELGTALAGVRVRVDGEEHLWSHRPAVFIFNHQSALDTLLVCKLLRRDFVGIGKREIRDYPLLGALFALAGTVFIDRLNSTEAVRALEPAVATLSEGTSIVIAPEGTRSLTPRLGKFKKGAFHLAMQAGVPIVPVVFHNALDALPKHALVVRPATVDVTVLEPIATDGWTRESLDDRIAEVHARFRETLGQ